MQRNHKQNSTPIDIQTQRIWNSSEFPQPDKKHLQKHQEITS